MAKVAVFREGTKNLCYNSADDVLVFDSLEEAQKHLKQEYRDGNLYEDCLEGMELYELGKPMSVKLDIQLDIS